MTPTRAGRQGQDQAHNPCCYPPCGMLISTLFCRATTREKAWERIVAMLRNGVRQDDCFQRYACLSAAAVLQVPVSAGTVLTRSLPCAACSASTLTSRCLSAVKKGGAAEAVSAATALGECLHMAAHCTAAEWHLMHVHAQYLCLPAFMMPALESMAEASPDRT